MREDYPISYREPWPRCRECGEELDGMENGVPYCLTCTCAECHEEMVPEEGDRCPSCIQAEADYQSDMQEDR